VPSGFNVRLAEAVGTGSGRGRKPRCSDEDAELRQGIRRSVEIRAMRGCAEFDCEIPRMFAIETDGSLFLCFNKLYDNVKD
jgi:hypothetical protein